MVRDTGRWVASMNGAPGAEAATTRCGAMPDKPATSAPASTPLKSPRPVNREPVDRLLISTPSLSQRTTIEASRRSLALQRGSDSRRALGALSRQLAACGHASELALELL